MAKGELYWRRVTRKATFGLGKGAESDGSEKTILLFWKSICSESMQNHSRTPKTCFTLGLESVVKSQNTGLLSPRIWGIRATFKAVLTAVDMK